MSDFKTIETQEDFDKAIKSRLAQKDRELEEKYKDYLSPQDAEAMKADYKKQLDEANKNLKDIQEKLKTFDSTVSDLTKRAEVAETSLLKTKIAHEKKLPLELAERLVGSTEEELKADAENLSGILKPSGKGAPPLHSGIQRGTGNSVDAGMNELLAGLSAQLAE